MGQQLNVPSKLKSLDEGVEKSNHQGVKLGILDPKPSELVIDRLKVS